MILRKCSENICIQYILFVLNPKYLYSMEYFFYSTFFYVHQINTREHLFSTRDCQFFLGHFSYFTSVQLSVQWFQIRNMVRKLDNY